MLSLGRSYQRFCIRYNSHDIVKRSRGGSNISVGLSYPSFNNNRNAKPMTIDHLKVSFHCFLPLRSADDEGRNNMYDRHWSADKKKILRNESSMVITSHVEDRTNNEQWLRQEYVIFSRNMFFLLFLLAAGAAWQISLKRNVLAEESGEESGRGKDDEGGTGRGSDEEDDEGESGGLDAKQKKIKKRLVILGTGWGSFTLLQHLDCEFDVTVISPRNYFLFTPLLPSCATGALEQRSIIEPIRRYIFKKSCDAQPVQFIEAKCRNIDPENKVIECEDVSGVVGAVSKFSLPYDYLVVGVGSHNNTFNTPGVKENANFLKSIEDSIAIRSKIIDCFESANYPGMTAAERKKLLSFVVVGGGPTGVEFAAELHDYLDDDLSKYFPDLIDDVSIHLIQSQDHILNTFDESISKYAEKKFQRPHMHVKTNSRVKEVTDKSVVVYDKKTKTDSVLDAGLVVWSTGVTRTPLVKDLSAKIGEEKGQTNRRALVVDGHLRVKGAENNIFAIGDCATVEKLLLKEALKDLFDNADVDNDGQLTYNEFKNFLNTVGDQYPQLKHYSRSVRGESVALFEQIDSDHSNSVDVDEFSLLLDHADSLVKTLPTTAQVASQEGKYLAKLLNATSSHISSKNDVSSLANIDVTELLPSFEYRHLGSFSYIGSEDAVGEVPGMIKGGGLGVWLMWKGIYLGKQFSLRNMMLVSIDWIKGWLYGRDTSRF